MGLMQAVNVKHELARTIVQQALEHGLLLNALGPSTMRIVPPLNITVDDLHEAVRRRNEKAPGVQLEASGGVTLDKVRAIAETGVDRISVGALTHSAPALDIALDFINE